MPDDVKNKISELEKELYSKDFKAHRVEDTIPRKDVPVAPSWDTAKDATSFLDEKISVEKRHHTMKKFVQFSAGFFIVTVIVAGFIWWRGSNIISGEKIDINISQPVSVSGGDPFETKFTITNNNKVSVEEAILLIEYPVGFYSAVDNRELPRKSKDIGAILPGQATSESISTVLYGQENTSKEIVVTLEYRMAGSNATLKKSTTYSIKISSSPVNIKLVMPKEVSSGQEIELLVDVTSNSKDQVGDVVVSAEYPPGFGFISSTPAPSYSTNTWSIPELLSKEKRTIKILGTIDGQENEEKAVKISVGIKSTKDERIIGTVYNMTTETSVIMRPVLGINLVINNNNTQDNVVPLGKAVKVEVFWQNNNSTKLSDAVIEVKLKGGTLDRYSIAASHGGYYKSVDNTIIWQKAVNSALSSVDPRAKGSVSFTFSTINIGVGEARLIKNQQMIIEVRAHAKGVPGASATEDIITFVKRSIKFETDIKIGAKGLFFSGPFQNTGPIPPQAEKETTYAISLTARNFSNSVSNAVIKTTLPIYVKWLSKVYPEGENITFSESTGEVTWSVARIPAGGSRDASFQISFLPSISHITQAPFLTGDIFLTATDDFTKTEVRDRKAALTTYISSDPQFVVNDANVVQ